MRHSLAAYSASGTLAVSQTLMPKFGLLSVAMQLELADYSHCHDY